LERFGDAAGDLDGVGLLRYSEIIRDKTQDRSSLAFTMFGVSREPRPNA